MDQSFELGPIDVVEFVFRDNLDIREKESRIVSCVGNAIYDWLPSHADLVDQLAMLVDVGM